MKKGIIFCMAVACILGVQTAVAQRVVISTEKTSIVLDAPTGGDLNFAYYGEKISDKDADLLYDAGQAWQQAYPVYGLWCQREVALSVTHSDGNMTLQMKVQDVEKNGDVTRVLQDLSRQGRHRNLGGIRTQGKGHREVEPVCFGLSAYPLRTGVDFPPLWFLGQRGQGGGRTTASRHDGNQEQGRCAQLAY